MDILLVDDEIYTIRVLKTSIDWGACGIDHVFTALSVAKAQEILLENPITLVVCDIEMPRQNGLDLLHWIRERQLNTEVIFLTCHTDFSYAQQAIKLGILDYCVKPIIVEEFQKVIAAAVEKIKEKALYEQAMKKQKYWENNRYLIDKAFWKKVLEGKQGSTAEDILKMAQEINVSIEIDELFGAALFSIKFIQDARENYNELFEKTQQFFAHKAIVIETDSPFSWIVFQTSCIKDMFVEMCEEYLDFMNTMISGEHQMVGCFLADIFLEDLADGCKKLCNAEEMMTFYEPLFVDIRNSHFISSEEIELPKHLENLLYHGDFDEFSQKLKSYFSEIRKSKEISSRALYMLRADICQALNVYLKGRNIPARMIFQNMAFCEKLNDATISVERMLEFVGELSEFIPYDGNVTDITNAVKKYIHGHLSDDIMREDIAEALHLNEDYISRVFRKDTGITIPQYINSARIIRAKELLLATDLSVGDVAVAVGYTNFSYFSKVFKLYENCTPRDFKFLNKGESLK